MKKLTLIFKGNVFLKPEVIVDNSKVRLKKENMESENVLLKQIKMS